MIKSFTSPLKASLLFNNISWFFFPSFYTSGHNCIIQCLYQTTLTVLQRFIQTHLLAHIEVIAVIVSSSFFYFYFNLLYDDIMSFDLQVRTEQYGGQKTSPPPPNSPCPLLLSSLWCKCVNFGIWLQNVTVELCVFNTSHHGGFTACSWGWSGFRDVSDSSDRFSGGWTIIANDHFHLGLGNIKTASFSFLMF